MLGLCSTILRSVESASQGQFQQSWNLNQQRWATKVSITTKNLTFGGYGTAPLGVRVFAGWVQKTTCIATTRFWQTRKRFYPGDGIIMLKGKSCRYLRATKPGYVKFSMRKFDGEERCYARILDFDPHPRYKEY